MNLGFRIRQALMKGGPWLTFAGTMGLAGFIHFNGGGSAGGTIRGFAYGESASVGAIETARVGNIAVEPGQAVTAGDILVTLDTALLDAEIAVVEAEKTRLEALIPATQADTARRLDEAVEALERDLSTEEEELVQARSEAKVLESERARARKLVEEKLAVGDELTKLDVAYAGVKPIVDEKPRRIGLLRKQLEAAKKRREGATVERGAKGLSELEGDLLVATRELEQLRKQRVDLVLKAPVSGRVTVVYKRAGEVVAAGEPIVTVVGAKSRVIACVPEDQAMRVGEGDRAKLWAVGKPGAPLTGRAVAIAPIVMETSMRCWRSTNQPAWGREVTIALDQQVELVPGQPFNIELDHDNAPPLVAPPAPPAPSASPAPAPMAAGDAPTPMKIQPNTRALSRIEPSGILYRPDLSRYVFVSDDTGQEGKDEKAPWLFAMDDRGAVDPDPIVISGVKQVNDLEAIAAGDGGEVYVLSSQSHSKKGKRPRTRTALLRLAASGRSFRVDGEVYLASSLEAAGADVMARLGLPDGTSTLEIEGMAFHRGALYFGLKAPLDKAEALIWKLDNPKALFEKGDINAGGLSLWARARLDAEVDGRSVPGGISELLFLPDGSLVITSTASSDEGTTETGRLWHAPATTLAAGGARLSTKLIKSFPGWKPEGLCLSSSPGKLVVAFDAGAANPAWLEMPWPQ